MSYITVIPVKTGIQEIVAANFSLREFELLNVRSQAKACGYS